MKSGDERHGVGIFRLIAGGRQGVSCWPDERSDLIGSSMLS